MTVRIVTDSTCDLPADLIAQHRIIVVPTYINVGAKSYLDGLEITRQEFYARLPDFSPHPTTSAPSIGAFVRAYEQAAAEGATGIVSIHPPEEFSSICQAARLAAAEMRDLPIHVVDARQLTLGMGLIVLAAAQMAEAGRTAAEIVVALPEVIRRTYVFGALDTLEFVRRGGRLNRLQAGLGTLLQIKPVFTVYQGQLTLERVRTLSAALARLVSLVEDLGPLETLAVAHAHAAERAAKLTDLGRHLFPDSRPPLCVEVTPVLGVHFGPGAVGFIAVRH
ncbi:MAG: DegV family protein [Anaerolineae bacterium]